jgi:SAM-dependent methyltransferase
MPSASTDDVRRASAPGSSERRRDGAPYRLAPGHILQLMYLKRRLRGLRGKRFIEVGAGNGHVSSALLALGMSGVGFDLNASACLNNSRANGRYIEQGRYAVRREDFLTAPVDAPADLIISCMVIEHLPQPDVDDYFARCLELLAPAGMIVTVVPGSPRHWGIEDEIAGHQKRYTREDLMDVAARHALAVRHIAGLTYPLSNLLLGLSNRLVRRAESWKLATDEMTRTVASGDRDVMGKTVFPSIARYAINGVTMFPFHLLQLASRRRRDALVLYAEMFRARA